MKELGYVRKRVHNRAYEADPLLQSAYEGMVRAFGFCWEKVVFMDEVAVVSEHTPSHTHALTHTRTLTHPHIHANIHTITCPHARTTVKMHGNAFASSS